MALTFAILETALVFFAGQTLETAVTDSARLIMTGQAQTGGLEQGRFQERRLRARRTDCSIAPARCTSTCKTYTSFAAINQTPPVTNGELDPAKVNYSPGGVGDIEVVTLYYHGRSMFRCSATIWPTCGNNRLLVATAVFRNEPYQ